MSNALKTVAAALWGDRTVNLMTSLLPMLGSLFCLTFLARAFTPGELSLWALVLTSVTAIQMLDLGISSSIMKLGAVAAVRGEQHRAWASAWTSALVFLAVAVAVALGLGVSSAESFVVSATDSDPTLVLAMVVACVFLAPTANCFAVLQRALGKYRSLLVAVVASQVLFVGGVVVLAASERLTLGAALLLQNGQFALTLLIVLVAGGRAALPGLLDRSGLRDLFSFGLVMLVVNAMSALLLYAPLWVTSWQLSHEQAGAFAFAATLAVAARNLPLMTIAPVINRLAAAADPYEIGERESRRWWLVMGGYLLVAGAGAYLVSGHVGGEAYASVGGLAMLLVLAYGAGSLSAVDSQVLRMTDEQRWEAVVWVVSVGLLIAFLPLGTVQWGVWGAGAAILATQAVGTALMRLFVVRTRNQS